MRCGSASLRIKYQKSLGEVNAELIQRIDLATNDANTKQQRLQEGITELKEALKWEGSCRERAFTTVQEMLVQEHCRREQDEATILSVMENVMQRQLQSPASAAPAKK